MSFKSGSTCEMKLLNDTDRKIAQEVNAIKKKKKTALLTTRYSRLFRIIIIYNIHEYTGVNESIGNIGNKRKS